MSEDKTEDQTMAKKAFVVMSSQIFPINKPVTSIGRRLTNDLVLQNSQVSRVHAEIRLEDGDFVIVDLDSTSGTFVNNEKIEKCKIYSGDLILIASIPLMFLDEKDPLYKDMEKRTDQIKKKGE
jgi:pSer/pThr/pTyr-binding forkhead associated (FHA) protein